MQRVLNFSAGPSALPLEVLKEAQANFVDFHGNGLSILEGSHRVAMYENIHNEAKELIKQVLKVPQNYEVLFIQGGASMQFAMVALNLAKNKKADYIDTGVWSAKAIKEAKILGVDVHEAASSKSTKYDHIPENFDFRADGDYTYLTSNNTIYGTEFFSYPKSPSPLIIDASSDFASMPIDWDNVGLYYGGAQKNAGIAGVSLLVIRKDLIDANLQIPSMLKYDSYLQNNSMFNTPPVFSIYMSNLIFKWIISQGGIEKIHEINKKKASLLYEVIDKSEGFYIAHAKKSSRSLMNVSFNIKTPKLEQEFLAQSKENNMIGLKGHRILGGLRASIYNAVSLENVEILRDFMLSFAKKHA